MTPLDILFTPSNAAGASDPGSIRRFVLDRLRQKDGRHSFMEPRSFLESSRGSRFEDPQLLSRRLARFVEPMPAKALSERIGCDVRTAENIRRGHWPIARHWAGLIAAFGRDLTEAVFHPDAAQERLAEEVAELEARLAERRAALRVVSEDGRGLASRVAEASARRERRSFERGGE